MTTLDSDVVKFLVRAKWAALITVTIILISYAAHCFQPVPAGFRGIVTTWRAISSIQQEGPHFIAPWQDMQFFNVRSETATIKDAEAHTIEQQSVSMDLVVYYQNDPTRIAYIYEQYSRDGDLSQYINSAVNEVFKAVVAKYSAPDLIAKRAEVSGAIRTALDQKVKVYGAHVIDINVLKFGFDPTYTQAIHKKVEQDQLLLVAQNTVATAKAQAQQQVVEAEAAATAQKAKADGDYYEKTRAADADAYTVKVTQQQISQSPQYLESKRLDVAMEWATHWTGNVPDTVVGNDSKILPYLNLNPAVKQQQQ